MSVGWCINMKKISIIFAAIVLVLVTGCSKKSKLTCTSTQSYSTVEMNTEVVFTFEGEYATKSKTTMTGSFTSEDLAKSFAEKYDRADDYKVKVDGTKVTLIREDKADKKSKKNDDNKKDKIVEYMEGRGYTCK